MKIEKWIDHIHPSVSENGEEMKASGSFTEIWKGQILRHMENNKTWFIWDLYILLYVNFTYKVNAIQSKITGI